MSLLEQLDVAIEAGDLKTVSKISRLMKEQQQGEEPCDGEEEAVSKKKNVIPDDDGSGGEDRIQCVKRPLEKTRRKNKFVDGSEAIEDVEIDKKLINITKRSPRQKRPPFKKVKVNCRECHNDYMVDPTVVVVNQTIEGDRLSYLCSKCLRGKGR